MLSRFSILLTVLLLPLLAFAQDIPPPPAVPVSTEPVAVAPVPDASGLLLMLFNGTSNGEWNWALVSAILLLLTMTVVNRQANIPAHWRPIASLFVSAAPGLFVVLSSGQEVTWPKVVAATLGVWLMANGAWSAVVEAPGRFKAAAAGGGAATSTAVPLGDNAPPKAPGVSA